MKCSWLVQRLELIKRQFHLLIPKLQLGNPTWKLQHPEVRDAETSDAAFLSWSLGTSKGEIPIFVI